MTVEGRVTALRGRCPTLTFTVNGEPVATSTATDYRRGSCPDLRDGIRVSVTGLRQGREAVQATRVTFQRNNGNDDDGGEDDDDEDEED